jgi:hypothetical protein
MDWLEPLVRWGYGSQGKAYEGRRQGQLVRRGHCLSELVGPPLGSDLWYVFFFLSSWWMVVETRVADVEHIQTA